MEKGVAAWKFPPIVAAIAVTIVGAFYLGGPGFGMASGSLVAAAIVLVAVRNPPRRPISPAAAPDERRRILVVLDRPLEGEAVGALAEAVREQPLEPVPPQVLLLAPSRSGFLDRWASDVSRARESAQRDLVLSAASLAAAEVEATAKVGDEDLVQMVEDQLRTFPATEVVLVTAGSDAGDREAERAEEELSDRLLVPFRPLYVEPPRRPGPCRDGRRRHPHTGSRKGAREL